MSTERLIPLLVSPVLLPIQREYLAYIIIQPDGKIIIGGTDSLSENFQMIRYTPNGTVDTTFSGGSVVGPAGIGNANLFYKPIAKFSLPVPITIPNYLKL